MHSFKVRSYALLLRCLGRRRCGGSFWLFDLLPLAVFESVGLGEAAQVAFGPSRLVSRDNPQGIAPQALQQVFRTSYFKLPAYAGAPLPESCGTWSSSTRVRTTSSCSRSRAMETNSVNGAAIRSRAVVIQLDSLRLS